MHAEVANTTGFAFEALYVLDEEARPLFVAVVKATFEVVNGRQLVLAEQQQKPSLSGVLHGDDADTSSYRLEPEMAFVKPAADCVLVGHAHPQRHDATHVDVGFRVGQLEKGVRVFGDRVWIRSMGQIAPSRPLRFDKTALTYENAFGGKDGAAGAERTLVDLRNPVGKGFHAPGKFEEGIALPNLEDPREPITSFDQAPAPACFGFLSAGWTPRRLLAGTYDEAWVKERMPRYPRDFDRRFFNAAPAGLVAGALRGDETVQVIGASPLGTWLFRLPSVRPPRCRVAVRRRADVELATTLDTLVVDADAETVSLTWRAHAPLSNGPHDVSAVALSPG